MSGLPTLKLTAKEGKCLRSHTEHINDKMQKRSPLVTHLPLRLFGRAQNVSLFDWKSEIPWVMIWIFTSNDTLRHKHTSCGPAATIFDATSKACITDLSDALIWAQLNVLVATVRVTLQLPIICCWRQRKTADNTTGRRPVGSVITALATLCCTVSQIWSECRLTTLGLLTLCINAPHRCSNR